MQTTEDTRTQVERTRNEHRLIDSGFAGTPGSQVTSGQSFKQSAYVKVSGSPPRDEQGEARAWAVRRLILPGWLLCHFIQA